MAVRYVALLLLWLVVLLQRGQPTHYHCMLPFNLMDCIIDTNMSLGVSKSGNNKYYQLQLCSDGNCIPGSNNMNWFECDKVCDVCRSALFPQSCRENNNKTFCEERVDSILHKYCVNANAKLLHTRSCVEAAPTLVVKTTQNCSTPYISPTSELSIIPTVTITASFSCPQCQWCSATCTSATKASLGSRTNTMVLGALLGLSILLLIVVTTGWICTCWLTKTKKRDVVKKKEPRGTADLHRDDEEERVFNNPTYGGESMTEQLTPGPSEYETPDRGQQKSFSRVTYAMYEAVKLPKSQRKTVQSGQTYDRLDRESVNGGQVSVRGVPTANNDASYSQLGLQDQDVVNNYHVIKKDNE